MKSKVLCVGKDGNSPHSSDTLALSIFQGNSSIYRAYSWSGGQLRMRWEAKREAQSSYQASYTVPGSAPGCWWLWEHRLQRLAWGGEWAQVSQQTLYHHQALTRTIKLNQLCIHTWPELSSSWIFSNAAKPSLSFLTFKAISAGRLTRWITPENAALKSHERGYP